VQNQNEKRKMMKNNNYPRCMRKIDETKKNAKRKTIEEEEKYENECENCKMKKKN
jgi:hypothetical protein